MGCGLLKTGHEIMSTQVLTPLTTEELHKGDNLQDVTDCALQAAEFLCGMESCPYKDEKRRGQFEIVLNWRKGVGKKRRVPSNIAQLAALKFQMDRGLNGQPKSRVR